MREWTGCARIVSSAHFAIYGQHAHDKAQAIFIMPTALAAERWAQDTAYVWCRFQSQLLLLERALNASGEI